MDAIVKRLMENHRVGEAYQSGDRYLGGLPAEPSASEYGKAMSSAKQGLDKFLDDNGIMLEKEHKSMTRTLYIYEGEVNSHDFVYQEMHDNFSTYIHSLEVDGKEVDVYKSTCNDRSITGTNKCSIYKIVDILNDKGELVFKGGN